MKEPHSKPDMPKNNLSVSYVMAIKREKQRTAFTATGRDCAAYVSALGTPLLVTKFDMMAKLEGKATREFNTEKINPEWSLQQHIGFQQITGLCVTFLLVYAAGALASLVLRYLIYDSPLWRWCRIAWQFTTRVAQWLWSKMRR